MSFFSRLFSTTAPTVRTNWLFLDGNWLEVIDLPLIGEGMVSITLEVLAQTPSTGLMIPSSSTNAQYPKVFLAPYPVTSTATEDALSVTASFVGGTTPPMAIARLTFSIGGLGMQYETPWCLHRLRFVAYDAAGNPIPDWYLYYYRRGPGGGGFVVPPPTVPDE